MRLRREIKEIQRIERKSSCEDYPESVFSKIEHLLDTIFPPLNYAEASILVSLVPDGSCYGLEWSMIHLVESCDSIDENLIDLCQSLDWREVLMERLENKKC